VVAGGREVAVVEEVSGLELGGEVDDGGVRLGRGAAGGGVVTALEPEQVSAVERAPGARSGRGACGALRLAQGPPGPCELEPGEVVEDGAAGGHPLEERHGALRLARGDQLRPLPQPGRLGRVVGEQEDDGRDAPPGRGREQAAEGGFVPVLGHSYTEPGQVHRPALPVVPLAIPPDRRPDQACEGETAEQIHPPPLAGEPPEALRPIALLVREHVAPVVEAEGDDDRRRLDRQAVLQQPRFALDHRVPGDREVDRRETRARPPAPRFEELAEGVGDRRAKPEGARVAEEKHLRRPSVGRLPAVLGEEPVLAERPLGSVHLPAKPRPGRPSESLRQPVPSAARRLWGPGRGHPEQAHHPLGPGEEERGEQGSEGGAAKRPGHGPRA